MPNIAIKLLLPEILLYNMETIHSEVFFIISQNVIIKTIIFFLKNWYDF